jgi:hypothetical protein
MVSHWLCSENATRPAPFGSLSAGLESADEAVTVPKGK